MPDGIMSAAVLNLSPDSEVEPVVKLALQIIKNAIKLNADAILLELNTELHQKVQAEMDSLSEALEKKSLTDDQFSFKYSRLPAAFNITYTIAGKPDPAPPVNGDLFGNFVRIMLLEMSVPPWAKGDISTSLETIRPASKWTFESKDLTRRVELKRVREV